MDKTGYPISKDHNHINALQPLKDGIVFTAHNGGNLGSIIGIIYDKVVCYSHIKIGGIHDILVNQENIIFSDSFGKPEINFQGMQKYGSIF